MRVITGVACDYRADGVGQVDPTGLIVGGFGSLAQAGASIYQTYATIEDREDQRKHERQLADRQRELLQLQGQLQARDLAGQIAIEQQKSQQIAQLAKWGAVLAGGYLLVKLIRG